MRALAPLTTFTVEHWLVPSIDRQTSRCVVPFVGANASIAAASAHTKS